MKRIALAVLTLALAAPAHAQTSSTSYSASGATPGRGTFGLGAQLSGGLPVNPIGPFAGVVQPGLQLSYFFDDPLRLTLNLGVNSTENVGTNFFLLGGVDYFVLKRGQLGAYLGAKIGFDILSPSGRSSEGAFLLALGGGAEYFFSAHFSAQIFEGLALATNPTSFGLVTTLGLNWYF